MASQLVIILFAGAVVVSGIGALMVLFSVLKKAEMEQMIKLEKEVVLPEMERFLERMIRTMITVTTEEKTKLNESDK